MVKTGTIIGFGLVGGAAILGIFLLTREAKANGDEFVNEFIMVEMIGLIIRVSYFDQVQQKIIQFEDNLFQIDKLKTMIGNLSSSGSITTNQKRSGLDQLNDVGV